MSNQQNNQLKPDGFIKNPNLLKETERVKDLLGFDEIIKDFRNYLENIQESAIVGLIGPFGVGKSTMLYQLQEEDKKNNKAVKWIKFDAWKYPDKKDLWEGFIFDFIQSTNPKQWKKIRQKIDGEEVVDKKTLLSIGASVADKFLPGSKDLLQHFGVLFRSSPIKRVHEFQELLEQYINKNKSLSKIKKICIVVEDIDRAFQDGGIFFLETLNYFLKQYEQHNNKDKKKIIVIAPINTNYLDQHNNNQDNEEIYLKSLDYTFRFNAGDINFSKFIKEIIDIQKIGSDSKLVVNHINYLLKIAVSHSFGLSIRRIKLLIREANNLYKTLSTKEQSSVDIRIWLAFYFAKYIHNIRQKDSIQNTYQDKVGRQFKEIDRDKVSWLYKLLLDISRDDKQDKSNYDHASKFRIAIVSEAKYKIVELVRDPFSGPYYILNNIYIEKLKIH